MRNEESITNFMDRVYINFTGTKKTRWNPVILLWNSKKKVGEPIDKWDMETATEYTKYLTKNEQQIRDDKIK